MKGYVVYNAIQQLKERGFKRAAVAKQLNIDRRTVGRYWDMTVDEYEKYLEQKRRESLLEPYKQTVLLWLRTYSSGTDLRAPGEQKLVQRSIYLKNQWIELNAYLRDGRIELSNNRAERSIKPFVSSRKNFLFANTPGGALCSAILFSLIETAKENGLDPYRYLTWVLTKAPKRAAAGSVWAAELTPQHAPSLCGATSNT